MRPGDLLEQRYRLQSLVGQGRTGEVWLARNELIDRPVAIKILPRDLLTDNDRSNRFFAEMRSVGRVRHPAVVELIDLGVAPQGVFLVMELLKGELLSTILSRRQKLTIDEAIVVMVPVAEGVQASHTAGIVHGDLRITDILLHRGQTGKMQPKIMELGLQKALKPRNTPPSNPRADVARLSALFFQLVVGRAPNAGESLSRAMPGAPPAVLTIIDAALGPLQKCPTAGHWANELSQYLQNAGRGGLLEDPDDLSEGSPTLDAREISRGMGIESDDGVPADGDETLVEDPKDWPPELRAALPQTAPPRLISESGTGAEPLRTLAMERLQEPYEMKPTPAPKPKMPPRVERTPTLRPPSFHQSPEDSKPRIETMHGVPLQKIAQATFSKPSAAPSWGAAPHDDPPEAEDQAETVTAKKGSPMAAQLRDAMLNATLPQNFGTPKTPPTSQFQETLSFVRHDAQSPVSPILAGPADPFADTAGPSMPVLPKEPPASPPPKEPQTMDVLPPVNRQGAVISAPVGNDNVAPVPVGRKRRRTRADRERANRVLGIIVIIACFLVGAAMGILLGVLQTH